MDSRAYFDIGAEHKRGEKGYVMSQSSLKLFAQDPWSWIEGRTVEETKSMEWGNLLDVLYLTPENFSDTYVLFPKVYPSPTKADPHQTKPWNMQSQYCKDWAAQQRREGKFPVFRKTFDEAKKALEKLFAHPVASALRADCETQVVCQWEWTDPVTGITLPLKAMLDLAPYDAPFLSDFKSTNDASASGFRKTASRFRYDLQGAFYQWGYRECYRDTEAFGFIVSESKPPYPVSAYHLTPNDFIVGRYGGKDRWGSRMGFQQMLQLYAKCLDTGNFPQLNNGELIPLDLYRS